MRTTLVALLVVVVLEAGCASSPAPSTPARDPKAGSTSAGPRPPAPTAEAANPHLPLDVAPPVPAIDATVASVKEDVSPALVLLSVGSAEKVEKGFRFSVYRGDVFIGKVVVEKVLEHSCGCRVLFTKEGESIRAGDACATRLQ